jgi:hypothetical protein
MMRNAGFAIAFIQISALAASNSAAAFFPLSAYNITPTVIAKDAVGNTYVAGVTLSNLFPATAGAFQTTFGGRACCSGIEIGNFSGPCSDVFVLKFSPGGNLIYATYLGGNGDDQVTSFAVDSQGNLWLAGSTTPNLDGADTFPVTAHNIKLQLGSWPRSVRREALSFSPLYSPLRPLRWRWILKATSTSLASSHPDFKPRLAHTNLSRLARTQRQSPS